jgi:hypothetical protein
VSLLIVRHGRKRGRLRGYLDPALARVVELAPALARELRFHETGNAAPDLAGVRAIVFWLADPLREAYPACYAEASALERRARERGIACVNPPDALSNSIKSVQARLWQAAGIPTPASLPFASRAELEQKLDGIRFPVLLKGDRIHSQDSMRLCASMEELRALPDAELVLPGLAMEFVDTREGYERSDPESVWGRYYHKKRLIVFGDAIQTRHVFFSPSPIVGRKSSILWPWRRRDGRRSEPDPGALGKWERLAIDADYAYFRGACEAPELMLRAVRALGFDFAGIDYSTCADGRVVLWEANPYQYIPGPDEYMLPVERRFEERYAALCGALADFFSRLLAGGYTRAATNSA